VYWATARIFAVASSDNIFREGWRVARPLRILTIGHSYCVALNRALFRELARDPQFDVTLVSPRFFRGELRPINAEPEPSDSPLRMVTLHARWSHLIHIFSYEQKALRKLIREGDFDIVHAWEEPYIVAGYQIARAVEGTPARFCFRTAQSRVKRYPPPFHLFERVVLKRAQGWIAGGRLVRQAMIERGFPIELGRTLTLAVDMNEFHPLDDFERNRVRCELGLEGPVIGFVGRLTKTKGPDVLMAALEKVRCDKPWSLLVLGSGEYEEKIRDWAARRGWCNRVKIKLTTHSEVPRYIGAMDMLVAPSQSARNWREQFGRMLVEAFACGVPVIGSDSGEIPFVVGDAGKIVGEHDVRGWTRAIEDLLADPRLREDLKQRGLERAKKYSTVTIAQQYREYFNWLADRPLTLS
jgi:glycosyltransferase involved in cell wall biosynthesis